MTWLRVIALRIRGIFTKRRADAELDEELQSHLEMLVEENVQRGMPTEEARRAAKIALGGAEQIKEAVRDQRGFPLLESLVADVRFGLRMLRKNPGFTIVAVLTLALGIGANTYIFSIVDATFLHPLPLRDLDHIVALWELTPSSASQRGGPASPANFLDWRAQNNVFDHMAAVGGEDVDLGAVAYPEHLRGSLVSPDFFATLGLQPMLGRTFTAEEEVSGKNQVMVISYGVWQRAFASDRTILGKTVLANGTSSTVVGVMGPEVDYPPGTQIWTPLAFAPETASDRRRHYLRVIAHLQVGVTPERAQAAMRAIAAGLSRLYPEADAGRDINVIPLLKSEVGRNRGIIRVWFALVGLVLLIACANVANLLLARAAVRQREAAIRAALGANRSRLVRQSLVESLLLGCLGGCLGVLFAWLGLELEWRRLPDQFARAMPGASRVSINVPVLLFTLALTVLTVILFGLLPALRISKANMNEALKEGSHATGSSRGHSHLRSLLVVIEVTLSLALLVPTGLLIKSFTRLVQVPLGLNPDHVLTLSTSLPQARYRTDPERVRFQEQLLERVKGLPGVEFAAAADQLPLGGSANASLVLEGDPAPSGGLEPETAYWSISSDYFRTLQIPILSGRDFGEEDSATAPFVVAVNEAFVRRYWSGQPPLGRRIRLSGSPEGQPWRTVVAVVGDVRNGWDAGLAAAPGMYLPLAQQPTQRIALMLRTTTDPHGLIESVRGQILALDKDQPAFDPMTMDEHRLLAVVPEQLEVSQLSVFAMLALLLAAVGLYGVVAYAVNERTREIGIRIALGAGPRDVLRLVVGTGMALVLLGLLLGVPLSLALTRAIGSALFGITPNDPIVPAGVPLLLGLVGFTACYIPARRATKVNPMVALRHE